MTRAHPAMVPPSACRVAPGFPSWRCSIGDALFSMRRIWTWRVYIGGCQCLGRNHLNRCIYLISVAMAMDIYNIYIYIYVFCFFSLNKYSHISILYYNYPYYIIIIHTNICDIYNIYYPYNISIHAVLHTKMWNALQFHELESFESAQQMLGDLHVGQMAVCQNPGTRMVP